MRVAIFSGLIAIGPETVAVSFVGGMSSVDDSSVGRLPMKLSPEFVGLAVHPPKEHSAKKEMALDSVGHEGASTVERKRFHLR